MTGGQIPTHYPLQNHKLTFCGFVEMTVYARR